MTVIAPNSAHENLSALLEYIEAMEKAGSSPPREIPDDHLIGRGDELASLPGVSLDPQGETWIAVARLGKIAPPRLPAALESLMRLVDDPWREPVLAQAPTSTAEPEAKLEVGSQEAFEGLAPGPTDLSALFEEFMVSSWRPWSHAERPRRRSMAVYQKLFHLHLNQGDEGPSELLMGAGDASWDLGGTRLRYPLFTQACLLSFDPITAVVSLAPSRKPPRFESDAMEELGAPGLSQFQQVEWKLYLRTLQATGEATEGVDAEVPEFAPHRPESHRQIVEKAVHCLCADGVLDPSQAQAPAPARRLQATLGWTLFTRKSTNHFLIQDLRRLREALAAMQLQGDELPEAARAFVTNAASEKARAQEVEFRGTSSSGSGPGAQELYFPLPYNDEQVRIVQLLENSPGVVVQGPPGTGKSHTIANIICHYMANGKRVLVTSKGEAALKVIKDKMPAGLRELCVALLSGDEEGSKQFEQSIGLIVNEVAQIDVVKAGRDVEHMRAGIDELHARVAQIDSGLSAAACAHGASVPFMGRAARIEEVASFVVKAEVEMEWMRHERAPADEPSDEEAGRMDRMLAVWSGARRVAGAEFPMLWAHVNAPLPSLLSCAQLRECSDLARTRGELALDLAAYPLSPKWQGAERAERVEAALEQARKAEEALGALSAGPERAAGVLSLVADAQQWALLKNVRASLAALDQRQLALDAMGIEMPQGAELDSAYRAATTELAAGRSPFGLALFGEGKRVKLMAQATTILGARPDREGWASVGHLCAHMQEGKKALAAWSALAARAGAAKGFQEGDSMGARLSCAKSTVDELWGMAEVLAEVTSAEKLCVELFGRVVATPESLLRAKTFSKIHEVLERHAHMGQLDAKIEACTAAEQSLGRSALFEQGALGSVQELMRKAVEGAFDEEASEAWERARERARSLEGARLSLKANEGFPSELEAMGCGDWAGLLVAAPGSGSVGDESFGTWRQAWRWRAWSNELDRMPGHAQVRGLLVERHQVEDLLAEAYRAIVVKKTWIEVRGVCTDDVKQKLKSYLSAVRSIGKGTGKRAERFREDARAALEKARRAICCWIMPHWRVSESMPSEIGVFDLVIVDEASQSDIWALPAILRAKKILIVGDPKQVSPAAVGVAEDQILQLRARYLSRQPHKAQMTQDKSIYDLGDVVFAASYVMLKEHFRCAPAIIEFSNREFYGGEIVPLRTPTVRDGMTPLVDLWVKNGFRDASDVNLPEAWAIVDEIKSLVANPDFEGKTFGVVTLLGSNQRGRIDALLRQSLTDEEYMVRKIRVGSPEQFQGDERDVMFISNVLARPVEGQTGVRRVPVIGMSNLEGNKQRLNVAMSRARDRVYLVRSLGLGDLSSDQSLTAKLFRHFSQPFAQDAGQVEDLKALCESEFERQVFGELTRAGYRTTPQFSCGRSRIDLVVEGDDGARVAIECDGDRYHSGDDWLADLRRQRVMERAGWVFWRSFASSFARDRAGVVADLKGFLAGHGVHPNLGIPSPGRSFLVESRVVNPKAPLSV